MREINTIIFDFDGVIAESVDIKTEAFASLFKDYPEKIGEVLKIHLSHGGLSRYVKFDMINDQILHIPLTEEKKKELGETFSEYVYKRVIECPLVKGAAEFLEKYYQKKDLYIVSGTPEEEIRKIVRERGLDKYFKKVYGAPRKKAELAAKILADNKNRRGDAVFVGDSLEDWEGADKAGIRFIGRVKETNPFEGKRYEAIIRDLSGLEKLINEKKI